MKGGFSYVSEFGDDMNKSIFIGTGNKKFKFICESSKYSL